MDSLESFIFSASFILPVAFRSVVRDAIAHRLLSTVDNSPEISINMNGTITHAGNIALISSKLTVPASAGTNPMPAAMNPRIPMESGTTANISAPRAKERPILSLRIENALCQKHWSPNGPANRPIAVGSPNPRNTCNPFSENSCPYSLLYPANWIAVIPPLSLSAHGTKIAHANSRNTI